MRLLHHPKLLKQLFLHLLQNQFPRLKIDLGNSRVVGEHDLQQFLRGGGAEDFPPVPLPEEAGERPGMIDVGVREKNRVYFRGVHRKIGPVSPSQFFLSLEESAVDEDLVDDGLLEPAVLPRGDALPPRDAHDPNQILYLKLVFH